MESMGREGGTLASIPLSKTSTHMEWKTIRQAFAVDMGNCDANQMGKHFCSAASLS
jgi:hypothetical protein